MNRRNLVLATIAGAVLLPLMGWGVQAKDAGFEGSWHGVTAKGGDVTVTVTGGQVTYIFRGAQVQVNGAEIRGGTLTLSVGALRGTVKLVRAGPTTANYSYSDSQGGSASAVLTRR